MNGRGKQSFVNHSFEATPTKTTPARRNQSTFVPVEAEDEKLTYQVSREVRLGPNGAPLRHFEIGFQYILTRPRDEEIRQLYL